MKTIKIVCKQQWSGHSAGGICLNGESLQFLLWLSKTQTIASDETVSI